MIAPGNAAIGKPHKTTGKENRLKYRGKDHYNHTNGTR